MLFSNIICRLLQSALKVSVIFKECKFALYNHILFLVTHQLRVEIMSQQTKMKQQSIMALSGIRILLFVLRALTDVGSEHEE
jgi:hypothetical protein